MFREGYFEHITLALFWLVSCTDVLMARHTFLPKGIKAMFWWRSQQNHNDQPNSFPSNALSNILLFLFMLCRNKSRERSFSSSSTSSRHSKEGHRKRSPSQEKDSYRIKRQRHDSENNKVHDGLFKGLQNGRLNESGADTVDNGSKPHPCSCNKNNENVNKREADISRFYDPEPRV